MFNIRAKCERNRVWNFESVGDTLHTGCLRNSRKSILQLRISVLGRLRDLQYIFAVIYGTLCTICLLSNLLCIGRLKVSLLMRYLVSSSGRTNCHWTKLFLKSTYTYYQCFSKSGAPHAHFQNLSWHFFIFFILPKPLK